MTERKYAVVEIEIDISDLGAGIDKFHRWRRFVDRPANIATYGVKITDWRIPKRLGN